MSSPSIEELYKCYDIVNSAEEKEESKKEAYQKILAGVSGGEKEKRLASQFISKFFKIFPDLYEVSFNKLLDLCEDDNVLIRKQVIQYLPSVGKSVAEYLPKIADTLTQMLVSDDTTEVQLIYAALSNVLKVDFKVALEAVFHQLVTQLEEANELINTYAFKYLSEKLAGDVALEPEMETFVETSSKKLLTKLVGKEEYSLVIGILSVLKVNSTLIGRQKLVNELSEQTKLLGKIDEPGKLATLLCNCRQAAKLLSKNVHAEALLVVVVEALPVGAGLLEAYPGGAQPLLRALVDLAARGGESSPAFATEGALRGLQALFDLALAQLTPVPQEVSEEAIAVLAADRARLSLQEAALLAVYHLCKHRPEAVTGQPEERLRDFRQRLQFLARVNQAAGKAAPSKDQEEAQVIARVSSGLQLLVRELFKSPPAFKAAVAPSWGPVVAPEVPAAAKRPLGDARGGPPPRRGRMVPVGARRGGRR